MQVTVWIPLSGKSILSTDVSSFQSFWMKEFHFKPNIHHMLVAVQSWYFIAWVTFPWCSLHQSPIASNTVSGWWTIMSGPCKISQFTYYRQILYNMTLWSQQCVNHSSLAHNINPVDMDRVHYMQYGVTYIRTHIKIFNRLLLVWNPLRHAPINKSTRNISNKVVKKPSAVDKQDIHLVSFPLSSLYEHSQNSCKIIQSYN